MTATVDDVESQILERAISTNNGSWSREAARAILAFKLADADLRRADELAAKARGGSLSPEESRQLDNYLRVGRLVEFMKAKALLSLKQAGAAA
ncbi:MAG: hypothetical protein HYY24_12045 [Verrucomicrobia bacterium]|nr:hypothetical protein [Verrucomicrobiota bacterium]